MRLRRSTLVGFLVLSAACHADPTAPAKAPGELTALPRPLTAQERLVVDASNTFAFELLRTVGGSSRGQNVFLSPLSASMALGMTANGAAGDTRAEMLQTLGFGSAPIEAANTSYRSLIELLRGLDASVDFRLANAIWYDRRLPVSPSFLALTRDVFGAEIAPVSFADPRTTGLVNGWVSDATNGKIKSIADELDPDLVMLLVNAMYFKGAWRDRFDPARTADEIFTSADGTRQSVEFMKGEPAFRQYWSSRYRAVELPYGASAYAMTIMLPAAGSSADELLTWLDAAEWSRITTALDQAAPGTAPLEMPKFKLQYERTLNGDLQALGMRRAFSESEADFSNMVTPGGPRLMISEVKQKTFVDVNEEGTEAAAVTSVGIVAVCVCPPQPLRIDRPFVFAIRERLSGTILFIGVINRVP